MKIKSWVLMTAAFLMMTSCGMRGPTGLSNLGSMNTRAGESLKLALIPSDTQERRGQVFGSADSSYVDAQFCSIQTGNVETCYQSETVRAIGSNKIYRITGDLTINPEVRIVFKAKKADGTEDKRYFAFARQNERIGDQLRNGLDRIQQRLTPLPEDKGNFELTAASGAKTTLKALFKTPYMILESTSPGCPPCRDFATSLNNGSGNGAQIKEIFAANKCAKAMIVDDSKFASWKQLFPATTYVGQASYTSGGGSMQVLRSFGYEGNSIPAFIMIDRNFQIIDSSAGSLPRKFFSMCK